MAIILGTLSIPFILNAKYMKAGLGVKQPEHYIVPSLETPPEYNPLPPPILVTGKEVVELPQTAPFEKSEPQPVSEHFEGQG